MKTLQQKHHLNAEFWRKGKHEILIRFEMHVMHRPVCSVEDIRSRRPCFRNVYMFFVVQFNKQMKIDCQFEFESLFDRY